MTDDNPRYADSCESCLDDPSRPRPAPEPLYGVVDGDQTLIAAYRCSACGHEWVTTWAIVPGRPLPPQPMRTGATAELAAQLYELAAINRAHRHIARDGGA